MHPGLVDAACSSFGDDMANVSKTAFLNTFNEAVDNKLNNTSPKKKMDEGARVPVQGKEADALIKRLDNALSKQDISPQVAWKKADSDGNGVVTVHELKASLQVFLEGEEALTPADFRMIMMAFDTNRNGRIEEDEFIRLME